MQLQGLSIACIRGWGESMCHAPIIPQKRGETQRVRTDTRPPPAHHLRLAHTPQWTAQRTALSPMTAHRHVEARNLWIFPHPREQTSLGVAYNRPVDAFCTPGGRRRMCLGERERWPIMSYLWRVET